MSRGRGTMEIGDLWDETEPTEPEWLEIGPPFRGRYSGSRTQYNAFLLSKVGDGLELRIFALAEASLPAPIVRSLVRHLTSISLSVRVSRTTLPDEKTVAAGYLDFATIDFTYGCRDIRWISHVIGVSFSLPNQRGNRLTEFEHAMMKVRGEDANVGTIHQLLRSQGRQLFDESVL